MLNTLVISDIHLGSAVCDRDKVLSVLSLPFNTLIINGDLFDNHSFKRYTKKDWKVLSKIRKISKTKHVVLVTGNHDGQGDLIAAITGMEFVPSYSVSINGVRVHCEHGDKYDHWTHSKPFVTWACTGLYYWIQKFDKRHVVTRKLKAWSKSWVRAKDIVRERYLAKEGRYNDIIAAGHTHYPEIVYSEDYNCTYINSGSFCDQWCSYITIDNDGTYKLNYI